MWAALRSEIDRVLRIIKKGMMAVPVICTTFLTANDLSKLSPFTMCMQFSIVPTSACKIYVKMCLVLSNQLLLCIHVCHQSYNEDLLITITTLALTIRSSTSKIFILLIVLAKTNVKKQQQKIRKEKCIGKKCYK